MQEKNRKDKMKAIDETSIRLYEIGLGAHSVLGVDVIFFLFSYSLRSVALYSNFHVLFSFNGYLLLLLVFLDFSRVSFIQSFVLLIAFCSFILLEEEEEEEKREPKTIIL